MYHVLALKGKANTGKSATIAHLLELISSKYELSEMNFCPKTPPKETCLSFLLGKKRVCLISIGDYAPILRGHLEWAISNSCDVIVCASRTKGNTVQVVSNLPGECQVWWRSQSEVTNPAFQDRSNRVIAQLVLEELEEYL